MGILFFSLSIVYADNHLNSQTGPYNPIEDDSLNKIAFEENNSATNHENDFDFMKSNKKNELDINKTMALDACIGSTNLVFERSDKTIIDSKFYTQETRLEKKVLDDKLELYGGAVLGASYYKLNNVESDLGSRNRIATLAGGRTGAKYNLSDSVGLVFEGQYNLAGEVAGDYEVLKNLNCVEYSGSRVFKTGFEWNF